MKSVFILAAANIRKAKAQSLLILVTILMASLLLATAIGIMENLHSPFQKMFDNQKASHLTMQVSGQHMDLGLALDWWQEQEEVESVLLTPYYWMEDQVSHNGKLQPMGDLLIAGHPGSATSQDQLLVVEGEGGGSPQTNEIWVPTGYAYARSIKPGDVLEIPIAGELQAFTVTAIVVDPQYSMSMMNPTRVWVAQEQLPDNQNGDALISVRLSDYSSYPSLWREFEDYLGHPVLGFILDYDSLENFYAQVEGIIGTIMLLFSIIIIVIALAAIAFTIANNIMTDYKVIGTIRTQGFSVQDVKWVYTLQYLTLAVLAIPLGIILSRPLVTVVMSQMLKSLGVASLNAKPWLPATITVVVMLLITWMTSYISAGKVGAIKPAEAIRNAQPMPKTGAKSLEISACKGLPIPLLLALKSAITSKRRSLFSVAAPAIMAFVLAFSINAHNSVKEMDNNFAHWGFDAADIFLTIPEDQVSSHRQAVLETIHAQEGVKAAVAKDIILTSIPAQGERASSNVVAFVYAGDMDSIGTLNLQGNNPTLANEVSLSVMTAKDYDKTIGDTIQLYLEGEQRQFLITGIYQSLNGMGRGFRIPEVAVREINPQFRAGSISIVLDEDRYCSSLVKEMREIFPHSYNIRTAAESGEINLSSLSTYMALIALTLSIIFMAVAFVIIFNTTLMSIYSDKKSFGIYKAIGLTPLQIQMSLVWKAAILSLLGAAVGTPLSVYLTPRALSLLVMGQGLMEFPFVLSPWGTAAAIPISIVVAMLSAWVPSGRILNLNPRNLIID